MANTDFFQFLERSLEALASEVPASYARICAILSRLPIRLEVDGRTKVLCANAGRHALLFDGFAVAKLRTQRPVLVALLEARCTLLDAVLKDDLCLRGSPDSVAEMHDALLAYLDGAVRSPSMPLLFESYVGAGIEPEARRARGAERAAAVTPRKE